MEFNDQCVCIHNAERPKGSGVSFKTDTLVSFSLWQESLSLDVVYFVSLKCPWCDFWMSHCVFFFHKTTTRVCKKKTWSNLYLPTISISFIRGVRAGAFAIFEDVMIWFLLDEALLGLKEHRRLAQLCFKHRFMSGFPFETQTRSAPQRSFDHCGGCCSHPSYVAESSCPRSLQQHETHAHSSMMCSQESSAAVPPSVQQKAQCVPRIRSE